MFFSLDEKKFAKAKYVDNFKDKNWLETYGRSNPTIRKIIYTSYAILNEVAWNEIPYGNEPQAYDCLQDVAFINLKKEPGDHQAEGQAIQEAYNLDKDLIHRQIQAFDPEVIIFGNTLQYFEQSLLEGFSSTQRQNTDLGNAYYITEKRLYILVAAPCFTRYFRRKLCDGHRSNC